MAWPKAIILCVICVLQIALSHSVTARSPADITLKDANGQSHDFFSKTKKTQPLVFIFVLPDCPISNSYAPELKRLHREFSKLGFFLVYADADVTSAEAREHWKSYDFGFPGLLDPAHRLVKKAGATRTPEAAVFSSNGKMLYRGRIDDRYVDFGKKRKEPQHRDLQNALRAISEGKKARWPSEPPIGCYIP